MNWWIIGIVSFSAAVLGALGLGGGFVLLIYLTAFEQMPQLQAQGINLIFFLPIALVALILHTRNHLVLWKDSFIAAAFGIPGVFLGYWIATSIESGMLSLLFAFMVGGIGVRELFHKKA